jgi:phenylacetate-CoA ligase
MHDRRDGLLSRSATTLRIARQALGQRRVPFLHDEGRHQLRDARVRSIVRYAVETVPHYRTLFRREGIDPREITTADDLERLPLLERSEVQADPDAFRSTSPRGQSALLFPTNGTTGTPLAIYHDRESVLKNVAYGERERVVEAALTGKPVRYAVLDVNYGPRDTGYQVLRFYRASTAIPYRPARHMLRITDSFQDVLDALDRLRPDVFQGYGSYLESFFSRLAAANGSHHRPSAVLYGSDTMTPAGRRFVEDRFGIPVISRYNAVEAFKIGFTCERRDGVHVEDDLCHVRLLDAAGRPVAAGALGEVVISNLVNRGTVLLNYRLGDVASWSTAGCSCGRRTPVLADVAGRLESTLHLPDGRFVPEGAIQVRLKDSGARSFQLVQQGRNAYELKLVTGPAEYERVAGRSLAVLRDLLGSDATVETSFHPSLPPGPRGIFKYVLPLREPAGTPGS